MTKNKPQTARTFDEIIPESFDDAWLTKEHRAIHKYTDTIVAELEKRFRGSLSFCQALAIRNFICNRIGEAFNESQRIDENYDFLIEELLIMKSSEEYRLLESKMRTQKQFLEFAAQDTHFRKRCIRREEREIRWPKEASQEYAADTEKDWSGIIQYYKMRIEQKQEFLTKLKKLK